jgi:hypothetical protein
MNHQNDETTDGQHSEPRLATQTEHLNGGHHSGHQTTGGTMRKTLHTAILILTICLVQFFTVATLKVLNAGSPGGQAPASGGLDCVSGDVNSDDAVNIADAIYVLTYLFNGGPEPVACAGNPTEVVVTGITDVNVINNAAVEVTNTPDVNVANIPSVTVTNIPEVIVTNTADINVVNIPPVEIASMPLVSDDFVSALGQFFPRSGSIFREKYFYDGGNGSLEEPLLTVPDGKVLRLTSFGYNGSNSYCYYFTDLSVNGELLVDGGFANADFAYELLPGDVISTTRSCTNVNIGTYYVSLTGYFLDYTP